MDNASMKVAAVLLSAMLLLPAAAGVGAQSQVPAINAPSNSAAVSFSDQTTDGSTVTVDAVNATDGGFVVIHDDRLLEGVVTDSVIGVSEYLEPGLNENVTVTLYDNVSGAEFEQSELTANETLIAMPHRDTNGNETYDFVATNGTEDGPYLDNGSAVTDAANITVVDQPVTGESFTVSNLSAPAVVEQGEVINVTATVTNPNDEADTQTVEFRFDGELFASETLTLNGTESTEFGVTLDTSEVETGLIIHGVYTRDSGIPAQIRIVEEIQSFEVAELEAPESVAPGDETSVNATITNPNDFPIEQPVEFRFDGDRLDTQQVSIDGDDSVEVSFQLDTEGVELGTYIYSVFTNTFGEDALITIEEPDEEDDETEEEEDEGDDEDEADEGDDEEEGMADDEMTETADDETEGNETET